MKKLFIVIVFIAILFSACGKTKSSDNLKLKDVYYDYLTNEECQDIINFINDNKTIHIINNSENKYENGSIQNIEFDYSSMFDKCNNNGMSKEDLSLFLYIQMLITDISRFNFENEPDESTYQNNFSDFNIEYKKSIQNIIKNYFK